MSKKSALHIAKGVGDAPFINPKWKGAKKLKQDTESLAEAVLQGDITALSVAITIAESSSPEDEARCRTLMSRLHPESGGAFRIGISGVPGVGKSTFLEAYCSFLLNHDPDARIAVLAVDPSSEWSKGSILGDKTRMESIGKSNRVFIRPSASGGRLGGVARSTFEAVTLCEAAGFNFIFVETVGVGQSETVVSKLTDCFLLLAMPGTGDELQGIKKGIMEMADVIALNKCDGDRIQQAEQSAIELQGALQLMTRTQDQWQPPVLQISALHATGMEDMWSALDRFQRHGQLNGWMDKRRSAQQEYWFKSTIGDLLFERMSAKENWGKERDDLLAQIAKGKVSPFEASRLLMDKILA